MYKDFNFKNIENVHDEICKIASMEDENTAIVRAFHFQRYYTKTIKDFNPGFTGYDAIIAVLKNIRMWIGNEEGKIANNIDYLWGNIPWRIGDSFNG